jgi:hypothetical protein
VNDEHDPVDSSSALVQLFQGQVGQETSTQEEERVNTWKGIGHRLKHVRTGTNVKNFFVRNKLEHLSVASLPILV